MRLFLSCFAILLATTPPPTLCDPSNTHRPISTALYTDLEQLSRLVDISYCVGLAGTGIQPPFSCLSRCRDFPDLTLVRAWNTGPLLSDSCGYIAVSHPPSPARVVVAFRGTYSLSNTLADLSTVPQKYVPYPGDDDEHPRRRRARGEVVEDGRGCENCTVHMGFYTSWLNTRHEILRDLMATVEAYEGYELVLVGHSLGGAVAALAGLDFIARGWKPVVTTFGEPRVGNAELNRYIEKHFGLDRKIGEEEGDDIEDVGQRFRRVTHFNDPVPLLPLGEWGYEMHAGEVYIRKEGMPPEREDIVHCIGPADPDCISDDKAPNESLKEAIAVSIEQYDGDEKETESLVEPGTLGETDQFVLNDLQKRWGIRPRYKLWQLFFAHRDYFWRLGLCVPSLGWGKDGAPKGDL